MRADLLPVKPHRCMVTDRAKVQHHHLVGPHRTTRKRAPVGRGSEGLAQIIKLRLPRHRHQDLPPLPIRFMRKLPLAVQRDRRAVGRRIQI